MCVRVIYMYIFIYLFIYLCVYIYIYVYAADGCFITPLFVAADDDGGDDDDDVDNIDDEQFGSEAVWPAKRTICMHTLPVAF